MFKYLCIDPLQNMCVQKLLFTGYLLMLYVTYWFLPQPVTFIHTCVDPLPIFLFRVGDPDPQLVAAGPLIFTTEFGSRLGLDNRIKSFLTIFEKKNYPALWNNFMKVFKVKCFVFKNIVQKEVTHVLFRRIKVRNQTANLNTSDLVQKRPDAPTLFIIYLRHRDSGRVPKPLFLIENSFADQRYLSTISFN
jgi:hypothetical protein